MPCRATHTVYTCGCKGGLPKSPDEGFSPLLRAKSNVKTPELPVIVPVWMADIYIYIYIDIYIYIICGLGS